MKTLLPLTVIFMIGCGGFAPYKPTVPDSARKRIEVRPLPPDPATEKLPEGFPKGDWVIPYEAKECREKPEECPQISGILISESRAYFDAMYRVRYKELRKTFEADRSVMGVHRELYESRLELADREIQNLQPGWWDRHKFQIGVVGGIVLGVAASVAILAATDEVRQ
jgi:hypothetical protein